MRNLSEIVGSLESKVVKLLQDHKVLKQKNQSLQEEVYNLKLENQRLQENLESSDKRIQTLKAANALLGSNDYKKETKLKINGLIREIDQCIVQLSE
ncbi:hypothetical protein [Salinimicrobium sp. GXAS 041]|uniref:hypothetical protein n=1 Tax=Salinimicrobium sp. GXAS 041 TaxID=3400806 RepID=UPI003C72832C